MLAIGLMAAPALAHPRLISAHGMAGAAVVTATGKVRPRVTRITATVVAGVPTVRFSCTAAGRASGTAFKRNARTTFKRIGSFSFAVRAGVNRVKVNGPSGHKLTAGRYRLDFTVKDRTGNRSVKRSASFKVK